MSDFQRLEIAYSMFRSKLVSYSCPQKRVWLRLYRCCPCPSHLKQNGTETSDLAEHLCFAHFNHFDIAFLHKYTRFSVKCAISFIWRFCVCLFFIWLQHFSTRVQSIVVDCVFSVDSVGIYFYFIFHRMFLQTWRTPFNTFSFSFSIQRVLSIYRMSKWDGHILTCSINRLTHWSCKTRESRRT